jgi:hypothetical protein
MSSKLVLLRGYVFACLTIFCAGCATTYSHVRGELIPEPLPSVHIPARIGVVQNPESRATSAASVSPTTVVDKFVKQLERDGVFSDVVYPYRENIAGTPVDHVLDVTAKVIEEVRFGENMLKAILHGASFFLLAPVTPNRFTVHVSLDVSRLDPQRRAVAKYEYSSEYDLKYSTLMPSEEKMRQWLEDAQLHAVRHVINQIKQDHGNF